DPQFQVRFRREAQNAASLNHPAIVAVYDTGETRTEVGPLPYIVMEFVDGRTLRDVVKTEGPLPPRRAMEIMADVCAALDFSHRNGIIHRDVKPANVMVTHTGAVKVMDFGIARALGDGQAAVTQTAAVIGTAQYLSPEQARGESVDARSDVYATGCVLYEMLTGEPPFTGDSPVAVAYQHVREDPRPPSSVNPRINPVLDAVVLKAMSKNPANRYQSAAEMRMDLVRVLSGQRPGAPMVMSDEERTSMMRQTAPTHVIPGRHRPETLNEDDDGGSRKGVIAVVALLTVAVLALAALALAGVFSGDPPQVSVPDVVGQQVAQAELALNEQGLRTTRNLVASTEEQRGTVVRTDPAANTQVEKGSTVTLDVGNGPETAKVPSLIDLTPEQAEEQLKKAGLALAANQQQQVVEDEAKIGKVVAQNPAPLTDVTAGTQVQITIGVAPEKVKVISVIGDSFDEAKSNLEAQGLVVQRQDVDSPAAANEVVDQDPKAGAEVNKGATVTLKVSRGSQIKMPDIVGDDVETARQKLRDLGWDGTIEETPRPAEKPSDVGKILDQQIPKDQTIGKDQTIRVIVGSDEGQPTTTTGP
ncbi:MAG TPA: Stk1 family PASTA domain-containing Ser/Thr kinase, partial [Pseudonocardiaceae bacterium]|nr:Stk1 family PASTA domain-containing Ser/Thr kinase [Pseudonocardiaceae bacterium]